LSSAWWNEKSGLLCPWSSVLRESVFGCRSIVDDLSVVLGCFFTLLATARLAVDRIGPVDVVDVDRVLAGIERPAIVGERRRGDLGTGPSSRTDVATRTPTGVLSVGEVTEATPSYATVVGEHNVDRLALGLRESAR